MNRKELKVGDEVAIGRDRDHRLARGMVVDLRSWVRVYDKELGKATDILREHWTKERYASGKWNTSIPQSGILVRIHDHDDVWSEPRIAYVRDIARFWPEEEQRQAKLHEAGRIRRERISQMKDWLNELGIPYDEHSWGYGLDREVRISYEDIEKLVDRFNEARLSG
jgi:hypothetical protein